MSNKVLTSDFNNLYNPIFCNLFKTNKDGFMPISNANFGNNMTTDPNYSFSTPGSESNCSSKCKSDNWCTSYSYDTNTGQCKEYTSFPTEIVNNVYGINSGYNLGVSYDYNKLSADQQNNIRLKCMNQYLNNTFTPNNPEINFSSCLNIQNQDSSTSNLNLNAQCIYTIYNSMGVKIKTTDNGIYNDNPSYTTSKSDTLIDNYKKIYDEYTADKNSISNINNILTPLDSENNEYNSMITTTNNRLHNQYINTINDKSDKIKTYSDDIQKNIGVENFENEYKNNVYKNSAKFLILFIIILFLWYIILMVSK